MTSVLDLDSAVLSEVEAVLAAELVAHLLGEVEVELTHLDLLPPVLPPVDRPASTDASSSDASADVASTTDASADVAALTEAVEAVLAVDPVELPAAVAVDRAAALLALQERLQAAVLTAVADVDGRELFAEAHAGSTRSWLRQQVTGDRGQLALARRLRRFSLTTGAVAAGQIGLASAAELTAVLDRLPEQLPEHQLLGVLQHGLPDTLDVAHGGPLTADDRTPAQQQLAAELDQVVAAALQDVTSAPADRLEPAFLLLATALPHAHLGAALARLADALQPEALAEREQHAQDARSWRLVKKRFQPGYRLEADLTDEDGLALAAEMHAREAAIDAAAAALARAGDAHAADPVAAALAAEDGTGEGDVDADDDAPDLQAQELPTEDDAPPWPPAAPSRPAAGPEPPPLEGAGATSAERRRYDAFLSLVRDAAAARGQGRGSPHPFAFTVTATLQALQGQPGALPGTLHGPDGPVSLSTAALRRLGCGSALSAVLLDAAGTPVGASSTHRHATARERRALHARQGQLCGVAACPNPWTVPHHVEPWWKTGRTALPDLLGICDHCHHDVHDGHRTLQLRDGRRLDEHGWVAPATCA